MNLQSHFNSNLQAPQSTFPAFSTFYTKLSGQHRFRVREADYSQMQKEVQAQRTPCRSARRKGGILVAMFAINLWSQLRYESSRFFNLFIVQLQWIQRLDVYWNQWWFCNRVYINTIYFIFIQSLQEQNKII